MHLRKEKECRMKSDGVETREKGWWWRKDEQVCRDDTYDFYSCLQITYTLTTHTLTYQPHPHLSVFSLFWERWGVVKTWCTHHWPWSVIVFFCRTDKLRAGLLIISLYQSVLGTHLHPGLFFLWLCSFDSYLFRFIDTEPVSSHCHITAVLP